MTQGGPMLSFLMISLLPGMGPLPRKGKKEMPTAECLLGPRSGGPCWTLTFCLILVSKVSKLTGPVAPEGRPG